MPHIHLETTSDLPENANIPDILEALVSELARQHTVEAQRVKAYHSLRSNWSTGPGHPAGIAHCSIGILGGRSLELRKSIADAMAKVLSEQFSESLAAQEVGVTLELREMDPDTYRRVA